MYALNYLASLDYMPKPEKQALIGEKFCKHRRFESITRKLRGLKNVLMNEEHKDLCSL